MWAGAVHDGPLQLLVAAMQELAEPGDDARVRARRLLADAVAGLRDVLSGSDCHLDAWELRGRLEEWADLLTQHRAIHFGIVVDVDAPVCRLAHDAARELLTNATRHSGASQVRAHVNSDAARGTTVRVFDDGCGMPVHVYDGYGLQVLRRRVELTGGSMHHRRLVAGGTMAEVQLPASAAPSVHRR